MDLRVLLFVSVAAMLVFPQYAFSIEPPSGNSSSILPGTTNSTSVFVSQETSNNGTSGGGNSSSTTSSNANVSTPVTNSTIPSGTNSSNNSIRIPVNNTTNVVTLDPTSSAISPNLVTAQPGSSIPFTVKIIDTSNSPSIPTGTVSWNDGNVGGAFSSTSCALLSGSCIVSYTPPINFVTDITITANYAGDGTHAKTSGISTVKATALHGVTQTLTSNAGTINLGSQVHLTTTLADVSNSPTTPTGTVSWTDDNLGGKFSQVSCTLSSAACSVSYTPPPNYGGSVLITANYGGDLPHAASKAQFTLVVAQLSSTTTTITPSTVTINQGSQTQFTASVADTSSLPTIPDGAVSWSDGNAGGSFNPSSCTLSSAACSVSYTPSINPTSSVTITAVYGGNSMHVGSTGTSALTIHMQYGTVVSVTPNPASIVQGSHVQLTATLTSVSSQSTIVTGDVSWSDGNAGGSFAQTYCTLSSNACSISYTPSVDSTDTVTITATYGGDSSHSGSFGTVQSKIIVLPSSLLLNTDQTYYAYGDVVTLSVNLPDQSLQSIAVGVSNPSGDNIISRTITTNENGTGYLQFKIPDTYQTGVYQDIATATVDGRNYTNSTEFNVIKSHGISIASVQITNQQGNPVSILPKGQNGFVKVSISSGEKMPALLTLNLFDANQSSLGTTSIKSIVNPGTSQMTLSFFIPSNVKMGLANVFTDVYSDWPNNGGTPLTAESCLTADLQDISTLPAAYVPAQPHSCTNSPSGLPGVGSVLSTAMTNNQAQVTLGIAIQNDSMTFMSPTEAHLLALAYDNGTGQNAKSNSVGIVNVDLNSLDTTNATLGNATSAKLTQFTTLAGPDLQNNPMAMKILQEIQASKRQVANILRNETAAKLDQQLVLQQRQAAASQLKQDLTTLAAANASTSSNVAYTNFLTTVNDNRTYPVFQDEFNFMKQRVTVANTAMQSVLNSGGSLGQALATFNKYVTINHVQMVSLNNELNVEYGLADSRTQSCFDNTGQLTVVNGVNTCIQNIENNSTGPNGIAIISVQPTDQQGNPVSLIPRGQTGYVKVVIQSDVNSQSLVTVNLFDSNISSLGTASAQYTLSPGQSEVVLPYYVPAESGTGLASVYANIFTDWPNKGGTSQSNEQSYFVGLS
ncbi:MAG: hypothetical protein ACYC6W_06140 [Nitrosotalea sp.]